MRQVLLFLLLLTAQPALAQPVPAATATAEQREADLARREADLALKENIQEAREAVQSAGAANLQIIGGWLSAILGLMGVLITLVTIGFAYFARRDAIDTAKREAIAAAKEEIAGEKDRIVETALAEVRQQVEVLRASVEQARGHAQEIVRLHATAVGVVRGEQPTAEQAQALEQAGQTIADKPEGDRTSEEFDVQIGAAALAKDYQQVIDLAIAQRARFADASAQANALYAQAWALGELGRHDEAARICEELIARFSASDAPAVRRAVAMALVGKGFNLGKLGRRDEGIAAYDDLLGRFGAGQHPGLDEQVARALVNKGAVLDPAAALPVHDDVIARFGASEEPAMRRQVAMAWVHKGIDLVALHRHDEALVIYDDVIDRLGGSDDAELRERAVAALFNSACSFGKRGLTDEAVARLRRWGDLAGSFDCARVVLDRDFDAIRTEPAFLALLEEKSCDAPPEEPAAP